MNAIWNLDHATVGEFLPLHTECDVDTVVIGGGVTGLCTALKLAESGQSVALLESHRIASGSTGRSTGNLYSTVSQHLSKIATKHNDQVVAAVVDARDKAINWVEFVIQKYSIDCSFYRRPLHICVREENLQLEKDLADELDASIAAGVSANQSSAVEALPFPVRAAIRLDHQAQYNPRCFLLGLANAFCQHGGRIFERSKAVDINAGDGVVTTPGGKVKAKNIVLATHTPKGINLLQAEMEPYQEYGISAELKEGCYPDGAFWLRDDSVSLRGYQHQGKRYLVVIGSKHKTGQGELGSGYYDALKEYARTHFNVNHFEHQWSAQQYKPADLLPYIGRSGHHNVYVATGFAADGLTWGAVAADIISRQILGESSIDHANLFNPRRFTPVKSAKNWIKENASVAKNMLQGHFTSAKHKTLEELAPGEGKVLELDGEKVAAYRGRDKLSVVSAECPHMKCIVNWNGADNTWDCPCHGSRFTTDGELIEGPAYEDLRLWTRQS